MRNVVLFVPATAVTPQITTFAPLAPVSVNADADSVLGSIGTLKVTRTMLTVLTAGPDVVADTTVGAAGSGAAPTAAARFSRPFVFTLPWRPGTTSTVDRTWLIT